MTSRAARLSTSALENAEAASIGRLVAWTFGLAPVLLFLLTWSEDLSILQQLTRGYAFPVLAAELAIVFISFKEGLRLRNAQPLPLALLVALGIIVWATAATAPSVMSALLRTAAWTIHLFFALAIVNLWHHRMLDFDQHVRAQLVGFLLFFALLLAFVATTEQSAKDRLFELPALGHVRWFGYYAAAAIGLCALGFLRGDRLALLAAAAAFAMAFWTGTRGTIAAVVAGLFVCTILFHEFRSRRAWLLFALAGVAGFAIAFGLDAVAPIGNQGPDSMARFGLSRRAELWKDTVESIRMRPWLGWGEGQFRSVLGHAWTVAQPHNIVLQLLLAWGLIGCLLCAALAAWIAPRFARAQTVKAAPFQCAALTLAAYSFVDGALYYTQSTSLFALCCAAAVAAGLPESARDQSSPTV